MLFLKISAYFAPVIFLIYFVFNHGVNVPFWDDWNLVILFDKVETATVTFNDFFVPHNEHRIFFPRLIFVILAFLSKWDLKLQMYFSIFLATITFYLIYIIAKSGQEKPRKFLHLFNVLSGLFVFSLTQQENWLWGFQVAWFLINFCVVLAIFCLAVPRTINPNIRLYLAAISCFIASFSSAHGLMSWLAIIPSVIALQGSSKQKKKRLLIWLIIFVISCIIYSIGYQRNSDLGDLPNLLFFLQHPLNASKYYLSLLGNSISGAIQNNRTESGIVILAIFLFFNFFALKKIYSDFTRDVSPWLSLGWFAILFAVITTVGRSGFGWEQANDGRYITVSVLLPISCLQMWRLFICYNWSWFGKNKSGTLSSYLLTFSIIFLLFYPPYITTTLRKPDTFRLAGKPCLEVINYLDSSFDVVFDRRLYRYPRNCLNRIYPNPYRLRELAEITEKLGFRDFPRDLKFTAKPAQSHGLIAPLSSNELPLIIPRNNKITLRGWAALTDQQQLPELVLFSYDSQQSFFANANAIPKKSGKAVYWSGTFLVKVIPPGEHLIAAWVYDRNGKQFVKLDGELKVTIGE